MSMKRPVHPRIVRLDYPENFVDDALSQRYNVRVLLADYNFWSTNADELDAWLEGNLKGRYNHSGMDLYLVNEEDFLLFKLTWG